jgi:hypothetical protein
MGGACGRHSGKRNGYRDLVGKHEGKNLLEGVGVEVGIILE